jgi:hypothetical protein
MLPHLMGFKKDFLPTYVVFKILLGLMAGAGSMGAY